MSIAEHLVWVMAGLISYLIILLYRKKNTGWSNRTWDHVCNWIQQHRGGGWRN